MWKPTKKILFYLMLSTSLLAGISSFFINWEVFNTGKGVFSEIGTSLIFLILSFSFMVQYVKKLKEEET